MTLLEIEKIFKNNNLDTFGIIEVPDLSYLKETYEKRTAAGYITEFDEKDFLKKISFDSVLPDAKSVISVAVPYLQERYGQTENYNISKYAKIKDYHSIVFNLLNKTALELVSFFPESKFKVLVDSNPLFEKELAFLSGIGFYGKNGLIYTEKYGSFIFLGEIIFDVSLPNTKKSIQNKCLNCDLCVKACPNDCYSGNIFNPLKCISYITQSKSNIDFEDLHGYLWGCDICQDICPLNKNTAPTNIENFSFNKDLYLTLDNIILLSNNQTKKYFKETPVGWSGAKYVKRNAELIKNKRK